MKVHAGHSRKAVRALFGLVCSSCPGLCWSLGLVCGGLPAFQQPPWMLVFSAAWVLLAPSDRPLNSSLVHRA